MDLATLSDSINERIIRMNFGAGARIEFYETVSLLMENGVKLDDALNEIYNVYSSDGQKPKAPLAVICRSLIDGIKSGKRLSVVLAKYVDHTECSLIAGGEASGNMKQSFQYAVKVINKKREITGAVALATVYPAFLSGMSVFLINMVATQLVPKFARMSDPKTWEGAAYILYLMGDYVTSYGKLTLVFVIVLIVGILASMPVLKGNLRIYLDRVFPWSLYRMLHGSTFLLNVAVMVGSGVQMRRALESLAANANPWLKERIDAAIYGTTLGSNIGVALKDSGFEFPDRKAVRYLQLIANQDGFEHAVANFGERWMDESVNQAKATGKVVLGIGIGLIGALMILIMTGANGITDSIQGAAR